MVKLRERLFTALLLLAIAFKPMQAQSSIRDTCVSSSSLECGDCTAYYAYRYGFNSLRVSCTSCSSGTLDSSESTYSIYATRVDLSSKCMKSISTAGLIIAIILPIVGLIIGIAICYFCCCKRKTQQGQVIHQASPGVMSFSHPPPGMAQHYPPQYDGAHRGQPYYGQPAPPIMLIGGQPTPIQSTVAPSPSPYRPMGSPQNGNAGPHPIGELPPGFANQGNSGPHMQQPGPAGEPRLVGQPQQGMMPQGQPAQLPPGFTAQGNAAPLPPGFVQNVAKP